MALDEPKDTDAVFEVDGFSYVVDKMLLAQVAPITVDMTPAGFKITGAADRKDRHSRCGC